MEREKLSHCHMITVHSPKYNIHNNKEVYFRFTQDGMIANREHAKFYKEMYEDMELFLNKLTYKEIDTIIGFFDKLNRNLLR